MGDVAEVHMDMCDGDENDSAFDALEASLFVKRRRLMNKTPRTRTRTSSQASLSSNAAVVVEDLD